MGNEKTTALKVDNVPVTLRGRTKAVAAIRGMTLRQAVIEALERWCANEEQRRPRP